jgi:hypothetical protein
MCDVTVSVCGRSCRQQHPGVLHQRRHPLPVRTCVSLVLSFVLLPYRARRDLAALCSCDAAQGLHPHAEAQPRHAPEGPGCVLVRVCAWMSGVVCLHRDVGRAVCRGGRDFLASTPESIHQVTILFSDRGSSLHFLVSEPVLVASVVSAWACRRIVSCIGCVSPAFTQARRTDTAT